MLAIDLPAEIEQQLDDLAKKTGRSKASYAREAILNYLEDLEDSLIAEKALDEHYASGAKTVSLADVKKDLGMDS
jgi:RHH-type transcriptional regulator, rel operon repressor / antitoxin RelB